MPSWGLRFNLFHFTWTYIIMFNTLKNIKICSKTMITADYKLGQDNYKQVQQCSIGTCYFYET